MLTGTSAPKSGKSSRSLSPTAPGPHFLMIALAFTGLRVVRPLITILDLMREGRASPEHIERGFKDGIRKGIITVAEIKKMKLPPDEQRQINFWLKEPT